MKLRLRGNWGPRTRLCKFQFSQTNGFCFRASDIFVRLEKTRISLDFLHQLMLSKFIKTIYHSILLVLKIFLVFIIIFYLEFLLVISYDLG